MRLAAVVTVAFLVLCSIGIVLGAKVKYAEQDRDQISAGASSLHRAGTDALGRDRMVRIAGALLIGLGGSVAAALVASTISVGLGVGAAFLATWVSKALLYIADLALALPWIFMLMMVRSALPLTLAPTHSVLLTFFLLAILGAPIFIRVNFARALRLRRAEWLLHGRASGLSPFQLMRSHVLPHLRPMFLTQLLLFVPVCLIAEANLGALGLGISQPLPSWGSMLLELQSAAFQSNTHWSYIPMALMILILFSIEVVMFKEES